MSCFAHQMVAWATAMADLGDHLVYKVPARDPAQPGSAHGQFGERVGRALHLLRAGRPDRPKRPYVKTRRNRGLRILSMRTSRMAVDGGH